MTRISSCWTLQSRTARLPATLFVNPFRFQRRNIHASRFWKTESENAVAQSSGASKRSSKGLQTMEDAKRWADMNPREKVIFAGKQTSYLGISLAGLGLTGFLGYMVVSELFGTNQASAIYKRALKEITDHEDVQALLGDSIKGYDTHTRGGHWKKLNVYDSDEGDRTAFMRFIVSGSKQEGRVNVWLHQQNGQWEYTHMNVEVPARGPARRRVVLVENRVPEQEMAKVEASALISPSAEQPSVI